MHSNIISTVSSPSFVYTRSTLDFVSATNLIIIINHCLELRKTLKINMLKKCMHAVVIGSSGPLSINGSRIGRNGLTLALDRLLLLDLRDDPFHFRFVVFQLYLPFSCGG